MLHARSNLYLLLADLSWAKFSSKEFQILQSQEAQGRGRLGRNWLKVREEVASSRTFWAFLTGGSLWPHKEPGLRSDRPGVKAIIYQLGGLGQNTQDMLSRISLSIKLGGYPLYLSPGFQSPCF